MPGEIRPVKCEKCGQQLIENYGFLECVSCGWELRSRSMRHVFFTAHLDEIVEDLKTLGRKATMAKYRISPSTVHSLRQRAAISPRQPLLAPSSTPQNGPMPALPAFCAEWTAETQTEWLKVYGIYLSQKKEV